MFRNRKCLGGGCLGAYHFRCLRGGGVGLCANKLVPRSHVDEFYAMASLLVKLQQFGETPLPLCPRSDISSSYYQILTGALRAACLFLADATRLDATPSGDDNDDVL